MPAQIPLMAALHHDDLRGSLGIVDARRHHHVPALNSALADAVGFGLLNIVRIVAYYPVTAFAGRRSSHRRRDAIAGSVVVPSGLRVLVAREPEQVSPIGLIPRRLD